MVVGLLSFVFPLELAINVLWRVRVPNENSFPMISFEKFGPSHF